MIFPVFDSCIFSQQESNTGKYLNKKHSEYCKIGVYECLYMIILSIYFEDSKYEKLKYQSVDTTFIKNLYGIKVSTINDINGVPISMAVSKGAKNDAKIAIEQIIIDFIDSITKKIKNNNRFKQKIYGDSQYHTNEFYNASIKKGYTPITDINKRRTIDKKKLK